MLNKLPLEERLNTISHALGIIFGIVALILLLKYNTYKTTWSVFSIIIYGSSIIFLFTASTLYHYTHNKKKKQLYRIIDHIGIYILIAGTYTPVLLIVLLHSLGWPLFYIVWGIVCFGLLLKLFFTGRFELFSTLLYLVMGWLIVFDFFNVLEAIGINGVTLLFTGGFAYIVGLIFYTKEKLYYNHFIWHLFVLAGAILHFFMIFIYVI